MNINSYNNNYTKPSFSSLHMNEGVIKGKMSSAIANEATNARIALEEIAKDVEVFVKPVDNEGFPGLYKLKIDVQPKNAQSVVSHEQVYPMRGTYYKAIIEEAQRQKKNIS